MSYTMAERKRRNKKADIVAYLTCSIMTFAYLMVTTKFDGLGMSEPLMIAGKAVMSLLWPLYWFIIHWTLA